VCEPIFDKPLKDISFGTLLLRLFEISRRFDMQVQPQLILLQKTLLNIEGLGRDLYPDLDIWHTASPILREWMRERTSAVQLLRNLRSQWPELIEAARVVPSLLRGAARRAQQVERQNAFNSREIDVLHQFQATQRRRDGITLGAALLL